MPHNLRKWTLAAASALALGTLGIGTGIASADPNDGGASVGAGDQGGVNVGPGGVSGGAGGQSGGNANLGPFGGGVGAGDHGGVNLTPGGVNGSAGDQAGGNVGFGPEGGGR